MTADRVLLAAEAPSDGYPWNLPAVRGLPLDLHPGVTVLVGENGSGKSTLVEAIAVAAGLNPEGGSWQVAFATEDSHSPLSEHLRLSWTGRLPPGWFLRAESFYNVATHRVRNPRPGGDETNYHEVSHGESFLAVAREWFADRRFFVLDEPEAALSFHGQLALVQSILDGVAAGGQFLIATHSPLLMALPGADVVQLSDGGLHRTAFDELEVVDLWRSFLDAPERFLRHLG
ncbi:MAG: AAA family ATPase [Actinomycetota bacterium]